MRPTKVSRLGRTSLDDGRSVERYRLEAGAVSLEVMTLGASVTFLSVPDLAGRADNVVLAHERLEDYAGGNRDYFGATIGRVANRIARGRFELEGCVHQLACNDGPNHLHGGLAGFDQHCWSVSGVRAGEAASIEFERTNPAGEEGYPGAVHASVMYTLRPSGEVRISYVATTDALTVVNMTNHSYFNLCGAGRGDALHHELWLAAGRYLPIDDTFIPTGEIRSVDGTAFDFRTAQKLGSKLAATDEQLRLAQGFDHCMVMPTENDPTPAVRHACTLRDPASGRQLEVWTDRPGIQLYTGNFLDGTATGPGGLRYGRHGGICLETQGFPDAPNQPKFPSIRLDPGQRHEATTVWRFEIVA
jgi:aldose 1-epimerase